MFGVLYNFGHLGYLQGNLHGDAIVQEVDGSYILIEENPSEVILSEDAV